MSARGNAQRQRNGNPRGGIRAAAHWSNEMEPLKRAWRRSDVFAGLVLTVAIVAVMAALAILIGYGITPR
jgi:hypothetical protein